MRTHLITVGDELLSGRTINTNAAHIGQRLALAGAPVVASTVVSDDTEEIAVALRAACRFADVIVLTGGLGPTHDDVTLDGVATGLHLKLREDTEILKAIKSRYATVKRVMPVAVARMARIPEGALVLANEWGTAPGLHIQSAGKHIFVLPGVPREMRGIFDASVAPFIEAHPDRTPVYVRGLATAGVPESSLAEQLSDLLPAQGSEVRMAFLPGYGGVEIRLTTTTEPESVDRLAGQITERLGSILVGEATGDNLVVSLSHLLTQLGATLATAESCTGGLLGKLLTDRAGSSDFYLGGVVAYANRAKEGLLDVSPTLLLQHGAVSSQVAEAMAGGVRERLGADYALSITGIAGPGGGTEDKPVGLIYLGLAWEGGTDARKLRLSTDREQNRARAAYAALDFLRCHLLDKKTAK
jgi:nicotinamide-nucleotide amidase